MSLFAEQVYVERRRAVQREVRSCGVGALVLGVGAEFTALTGCQMSSHERLTALIITPDSQSLVVPVTDAAALPNLAGMSVHAWRDGEDPYALVAAEAGSSAAIGPTLTADHVFALQAAIPSTGLMPPLLARQFMLKESAEVAELEKAASAIDRVHEQVHALLAPGRTEAEVAAELQTLIEREHASVDFVIVGSGENGANPHHDFSSRILQPGDPVVVDIGGTLDSGYHSDCTRTYVVPGAPASFAFQQAYEAVLEAQLAATRAARPGVTAGELDAVARDMLTTAGYGEAFSHRLGHGIGLNVHEQPFIVGGSDVVLEAQMVFSVEPGVYVDGAFGIRIEDIVALTPTGARVLNAASKEPLC